MQAWIPLGELIRFLSWLVGLDHPDDAGATAVPAGRGRAEAFSPEEWHA